VNCLVATSQNIVGRGIARGDDIHTLTRPGENWWCRLRDSNPRPLIARNGTRELTLRPTVRQIRAVARQGATVRDKKSLVLKALMRQSPDRSATVLSVEARAEGWSDVEFRRISLQAIARGVSTTCLQNPMRGSSHSYICALRPAASICHISDPAVLRDNQRSCAAGNAKHRTRLHASDGAPASRNASAHRATR
jgi:hypothetical protein